MESLSDRIKVIGNPTIPRLAAFEILLEDGTVLWSKLDQADGHNNYPHVFPSNKHLIKKLLQLLGKEDEEVDTGNRGVIYTDGKTTVGVW